MGNSSKQTFFKRRHTMVTKDMKKPTASLSMRNIQVKTTTRYRLTQDRMAFIKQILKITVSGKDVEKRGPVCTVGGDANEHSDCGKQFQTIRNSTHHVTGQFHSWVYVQGKQTSCVKRGRALPGLFTKAQKWKQRPCPPTDE